LALHGLEVSDLDCGILRHVSLKIAGGECVCLSGASGSGKTRLLRAIADLDPNEGTVQLDGVERAHMSGPEWRRRVTYVPAESRWWGETVAAHFPSPELDRAALQALGLDGSISERVPAMLSSGERQRLALLRAAALEPTVVLLDEPTSNLDEENTGRVEHWLGTLRSSGVALLWVSHQPRQIDRVADRRLCIVGDRVEESSL